MGSLEKYLFWNEDTVFEMIGVVLNSCRLIVGMTCGIGQI